LPAEEEEKDGTKGWVRVGAGRSIAVIDAESDLMRKSYEKG
jgi:hypothetical protein